MNKYFCGIVKVICLPSQLFGSTDPQAKPCCTAQGKQPLPHLIPTQNQQLRNITSHEQGYVSSSQSQDNFLRRAGMKHGISNYLRITECVFRDGIIILGTALCSILGKFHKFCNFTVYYFFHLLQGRKCLFLRQNKISRQYR